MPLSKARHAARMRTYRAAKSKVEDVVKANLTEALVRRGITPDQLLDEWAAIAAGKVTDPLTWNAKVKALSEVSARLWPVPREPEQPKSITVRVIYDGDEGATGVEVQLQ